MALEPERSKEQKQPSRRDVLFGAATAALTTALPEAASAARHPLDPALEATVAEEAEIESRMQGYRAFIQERSLLIKTTLIMRGVFEQKFADVFEMLMKKYVVERLRHEPTVDGLHILADEGKFLSAWMIEEIKRRWKVGDDSVKEERIQSLVHMLSRLARESLEKEKPGEQ